LRQADFQRRLLEGGSGGDAAPDADLGVSPLGVSPWDGCFRAGRCASRFPTRCDATNRSICRQSVTQAD